MKLRRSIRRSYFVKKTPSRDITGRKQRAIESARKVESTTTSATENGQEIEVKIPRYLAGSRTGSQSDYTIWASSNGCLGIIFILCALPLFIFWEYIDENPFSFTKLITIALWIIGMYLSTEDAINQQGCLRFSLLVPIIIIL